VSNLRPVPSFDCPSSKPVANFLPWGYVASIGVRISIVRGAQEIRYRFLYLSYEGGFSDDFALAKGELSAISILAIIEDMKKPPRKKSIVLTRRG
jgi:hypothetical protein